MLLKHDSDAEVSDRLGFTVFHRVTLTKRSGVVDALVEAGATLEARGRRFSSGNQQFFCRLRLLHLATTSEGVPSSSHYYAREPTSRLKLTKATPLSTCCARLRKTPSFARAMQPAVC
ncbi:unnamed protein product [Hapterophycus canaliculatus]